MKSKFIFQLLIGIMLFTNVALIAQEPSLHITIDNNKMLIGDHNTLHIQGQFAKDNGVTLPDLSDIEKLPFWEILDKGNWNTLDSNGLISFSKDIIFTAFDSGFYVIPPPQWTPNGATFESPTLQLYVTTIPDSIMQLAPIKDIIMEPSTWADSLYYFLGILAFFLIIGLILFFINKKEKTKIIKTEEPITIIAPHELAFQKLQNLESQKLWQQGNIKVYQSELTHILREYLGNRYAITALESTTDEIIEQLKQTPFPLEKLAETSQLLQIADLVKFAQAEPPSEIYPKAMNDVKDIITFTTPIAS